MPRKKSTPKLLLRQIPGRHTVIHAITPTALKQPASWDRRAICGRRPARPGVQWAEPLPGTHRRCEACLEKLTDPIPAVAA